MKVECPYCKFTGEYPDAMMPAEGKNIVCPKCKSFWFVKKHITEYQEETTIITKDEKLENGNNSLYPNKTENEKVKIEQEIEGHSQVLKSVALPAPINEAEETKKCPFCAETIKIKAIKCRYCGSNLSSAKNTEIAPFKTKNENNFNGEKKGRIKDKNQKYFKIQVSNFKKLNEQKYYIFGIFIFVFILAAIGYIYHAKEQSYQIQQYISTNEDNFRREDYDSCIFALDYAKKTGSYPYIDGQDWKAKDAAIKNEDCSHLFGSGLKFSEHIKVKYFMGNVSIRYRAFSRTSASYKLTELYKQLSRKFSNIDKFSFTIVYAAPFGSYSGYIFNKGGACYFNKDAMGLFIDEKVIPTCIVEFDNPRGDKELENEYFLKETKFSHEIPIIRYNAECKCGDNDQSITIDQIADLYIL